MKDPNCIFCKLANGEIPAQTLYEDDYFRVILDLGPAAEGHALILPKEHCADVTEAPEEITSRVLPLAARLGKAMCRALGATGFNVLTNIGESAGQTVFHFHTHVIPRYDDGEKIVTWVPGTTTPEGLAAVGEKIRREL